jgi:hypothetical protein
LILWLLLDIFVLYYDIYVSTNPEMRIENSSTLAFFIRRASPSGFVRLGFRGTLSKIRWKNWLMDGAINHHDIEKEEQFEHVDN